MATNRGRQIIYQTKRELAERALGQALGLLGNNPDKNAKYVVKAIDRMASDEKQAVIRDWI